MDEAGPDWWLQWPADADAPENGDNALLYPADDISQLVHLEDLTKDSDPMNFMFEDPLSTNVLGEEKELYAEPLLPSDHVYLDPDPMLAHFPEDQPGTQTIPIEVPEQEQKSNRKPRQLKSSEPGYRKRLNREAYLRRIARKGKQPRVQVSPEEAKNKAVARMQRFRETHGQEYFRQKYREYMLRKKEKRAAAEAFAREMDVLIQMEPAARKLYCESEVNKVNALLATPGFVLREEALAVHRAREHALERMPTEDDTQRQTAQAEERQRLERLAYEQREERLMARLKALQQMESANAEQAQREQEEARRANEQQLREQEELRRATVERARLDHEEAVRAREEHRRQLIEKERLQAEERERKRKEKEEKTRLEDAKNRQEKEEWIRVMLERSAYKKRK